MFDTSTCAPSVVSSRFLPSVALRTAWLRPVICEVIFSAMAMPAASSLAALIRRPEDRRLMAAFMSSFTRVMFACAVIALIFVLMVVIFRSPGLNATLASAWIRQRRSPDLFRGVGENRLKVLNLNGFNLGWWCPRLGMVLAPSLAEVDTVSAVTRR